MDLIVADDEAGLTQIGADLIASTVAAKPDASLILATGNTPMGVYAEIAARVERGELDCSRLRVVQLDEYLDLEPEDERALFGWMQRAVLAPWRVPLGQVVRFPNAAGDPDAAARTFDAAVAALGGVDLAVLGLGPNGHLGFNEPPADRDAPTRAVDLAPASIASNADYWGDPGRVPRRAITAGMDVLLGAQRTLLLVCGAHKRDVLQRAMRGPTTADLPASWLQTIDNVSVVADEAAVGSV